ncbi:hypothetical protein BDZ97DRAFT_1762400 [Flammula alnicola]|nr:hypothetical protein BDZ97DRAFT_1762400 [Flammula alnicola]
MANSSDVDMEGTCDTRSQPSAALIAQGKAEKQAKKRARDEQEANQLIEGGRGKRSASEKAMKEKIWLKDGTRKQQSGSAETAVKKSSAQRLKKAKMNDEQPKGKRIKLTGKMQVPISQRSQTPPSSAPPRKQAIHYKSKAKSSRKRKVRDDSSDNVESEDADSPSESELTLESSGGDDSNSSTGEDEFDDELSEAGLAKRMGSELPLSPIRERSAAPTTHHASDLFEVDDSEVEVASRNRQQGADLPPLSDSEDLPSSIQQSSQEKVRTQKHTTHHQEPSDHKERTVKPAKASEKRNAKFREERSSIVSASPKRSAKHKKQARNLHAARDGDDQSIERNTSDEESADATQTWPIHAHLRGNGHRGDGLRQQNAHIRATCKKAIKIVERALVTKHAWPELNKGLEYRVEVLKKAAKALESIGPEYRTFASAPIRNNALGHIAVFQLSVGDGCATHVDALLACDAFVFPGKWEINGDGKPKPPLRYEYCSTHKTLRERELTIPLVALAATGVHAALTAWKDGDYDKKKGDKFDGETYGEVYNRHAKALQDLKSNHGNIFHYIMSEIYKRVIGNNGQEVAAQHMNTLAIMDLTGVPGID